VCSSDLASVYVDMSGALPLLAFTRGPIYLLIAAYNLATVTLANYWLVEKRRFASRLYRRQTTLILAAAAIIYVVYGYYLTGVPLVPSLKELDLNPLAFAVWGIVIVLAIFRYGLFELAPIARDALIEMLSDGVIVLDTHSRLVDANPAAQSIFGWRQVPVGQPAEKVMEHWIDEKALTGMDRLTRLDAELSQADGTRFYGVMISPLMDRRGLRLGYLVVVHDISDRKAVERRLHELSLVDDLTGLTNRRGFNMLAAQLFGMARRMGLNAALFFIDLDGLKQINDRLGHAAGDQALKDTALILKGVFRSSDIVARFGGDEFVVLAVETTENSTEALLARVRDQLRAHNAGALRDYTLSFSIGLARDHWAHPRSMDTLLEEADQAMYAAKQARWSLPEPPA
jgi:diguanylate cyclase (GGDEF)-like protein/PAS domain S-box-containing protein